MENALLLTKTDAAPSDSDLMGGDVIHRHIGWRLTFTACVLLVGFIFVTLEAVTRSQDQVIEYQARELAEVIALIAASARSVYAKEVVGKLKSDGFGAHIDYKQHDGYVPLPAQFLKYVGIRASQDATGLYWYKPVSKWNLESSQGIEDDFQRWAWRELEKQDHAQPQSPINWSPAWRIETLKGVKTLRYMRADPAVAQSCVECHNQYEMREEVRQRRIAQGLPTGKQWKLNQLLGALEVDIPLENVKALAKNQIQLTTMLIVGVVVAGLLLIGALIFIDITRARRVAKHLSWHASHDVLTGLVNRIVFEKRLEYVINRARLDDSEHALLFLDLDQFKVVNDTCGHIAGDELLRQLSRVLQEKLRKGDTLARLGGDEFGVILENCEMDDAANIAESLRLAAVNYRFIWDQKAFSTGISIGMVSANKESESVAALMSTVDLACYAAKDNGRNRVHVLHLSDGELELRRGEMEWVSRITKAMRDGRMRLAVQTVTANHENIVPQIYREVLLRMVDEDGQLVNTGHLIAAAERFNIMPNLDRWVVETVLQLMQMGKLKSDDDHIVAINLSGTSLNDEKFLEFVKRTLAKNRGVKPGHICFEITETAAIRSLTKVMQFMQQLQDMGCRFALDDFGSGISSFGYLKNLRVDFLKIDGEFVRDIDKDTYDRAMVQATVNIAKVLGIPTIAEWVEDDNIYQSVVELGVDYTQGFYIARPMLIDITAVIGNTENEFLDEVAGLSFGKK